MDQDAVIRSVYGRTREIAAKRSTERLRAQKKALHRLINRCKNPSDGPVHIYRAQLNAIKNELKGRVDQ